MSDELVTTVIFAKPKSGDAFSESVQSLKGAEAKFLPKLKVWAVPTETNEEDPSFKDMLADVFSFAVVIGQADIPVNDWTYTISTLERYAKRALV